MKIEKLDPHKKTLVLLHNLGTPDSPQLPDVRRYLYEFLMDPEVITAPYLIRWGILNFSVLPFRAKKSAHAYQSIWTPEGSPLLVNTQNQSAKLSQYFDDRFLVDFSMRYGSYSNMERLQMASHKDIEQVLFLPLYPQYSSSTTKSSIKNFEEAMKSFPHMSYKILEDFYDHPLFIESCTQSIRQSMESIQAEHLLLSFHGVPEDMIHNQDPSNKCLQPDCCVHYKTNNPKCYRAHCLATALAIQNKLKTTRETMSISFQSKIGPKKWLGPYTEDTIIQLAKSGVKRLCVASPAFVSDCLETIEELNIRAKELFLENGGESFALAPAANDSDVFVEFLRQQVVESFH